MRVEQHDVLAGERRVAEEAARVARHVEDEPSVVATLEAGSLRRGERLAPAWPDPP